MDPLHWFHTQNRTLPQSACTCWLSQPQSEKENTSVTLLASGEDFLEAGLVAPFLFAPNIFSSPRTLCCSSSGRLCISGGERTWFTETCPQGCFWFCEVAGNMTAHLSLKGCASSETLTSLVQHLQFSRSHSPLPTWTKKFAPKMVWRLQLLLNAVHPCLPPDCVGRNEIQSMPTNGAGHQVVSLWPGLKGLQLKTHLTSNHG